MDKNKSKKFTYCGMVGLLSTNIIAEIYNPRSLPPDTDTNSAVLYSVPVLSVSGTYGGTTIAIASTWPSTEAISTRHLDNNGNSHSYYFEDFK